MHSSSLARGERRKNAYRVILNMEYAFPKSFVCLTGAKQSRKKAKVSKFDNKRFVRQYQICENSEMLRELCVHTFAKGETTERKKQQHGLAITITKLSNCWAPRTAGVNKNKIMKCRLKAGLHHVISLSALAVSCPCTCNCICRWPHDLELDARLHCKGNV